MLQQTANRLDGLSNAKPLVICNEEHRFLVAEQMRQSEQGVDILLEPVGRNTAPAIALAAFKAMANSESIDNPVLLVLAADHVIENVEAFQTSVKQLLPQVRDGKFGTLGIVPTEPATGYGYIRAEKREVSVASGEQRVAKSEKQASYPVAEFVEKPDLETAEGYVASGGYYWNSGMFLVRADRYLEELKRFRPDIYSACQQAIENTQQDMDFIRVDKAAFEACPDESIDYAVMEPLCADGSDSVVVVPLDVGWSDVGSWSALWDIKNKDSDNNVAEGDVILQDTSNSFIYGQDRLVTTLGVDNLVIVDTKDALLVASKDRVQDVKSIVSKIKDANWVFWPIRSSVLVYSDHFPT